MPALRNKMSLHAARRPSVSARFPAPDDARKGGGREGKRGRAARESAGSSRSAWQGRQSFFEARELRMPSKVSARDDGKAAWDSSRQEASRFCDRDFREMAQADRTAADTGF